jgi:hypothetical protein
MTTRSILRWLSLVALPAALCACGGGGGGGGGGSTASVASVGTVSGFGSVIVNGVEFDTTGAVIRVDDNPNAAAGDLRVGMVAKVEGQVEANGVKGKATAVVVQDTLEGPVTSVAGVGLGKLEALDQTVLLDDLTVFEGVTAGTLTVGNVIEVNGFVDAVGNVHARRIELKAASFDAFAEKEIELKGVVADPVTATTFALGGLTVNFQGATVDPAIAAAGGIKKGLFVEVKSAQPQDANNVLAAASVQLEDRKIAGAPGVRADIEGVVTRFASAADFDVNGQPVTADANSVLENGALTDLAVGAKVQVEGTLDATQVLVAKKVSFRLARNIKVEALVTAVDAPNRTVTVLGTLKVNVDASTLLRNKRGSNGALSLSELAAGDRVKIRAFLQGTDTVPIAAKVEKEDPLAGSVVKLQGPLDANPAAGTSTFSILGITVDATNAIAFRQANDSPIPTLAAFLAGLSTGSLVSVTGTLANGTIAATELQLEVKHELEQEVAAEKQFQFEVEVEHAEDQVRQGGGGGGKIDQIHQGKIERLGSIFVNGREIETASAIVTVDNRPRTEKDLTVGMPVRVEVQVNSTTHALKATRILSPNDLKGPITAAVLTLDTQGAPIGGTVLGGTLEVLHQTVKLDDKTVFSDDVTPQVELHAKDLAEQQVLAIAGVRDDAGVLHATQVERKANRLDDLPQADKELELRGAVASLTSSRFVIGNQAITFTTAVLDPAIVAAGGLANGMAVEVRSSQALDGIGNVVASSITLDDNGLREAEGVEVRIQGMVTGFTSATHFEVAGQAVSTSAATQFARGAATDIAAGRALEVEGVMTGGVLAATSVEFELAKNVKIEGPLSAVDAATGSVDALGIRVTLDQSTQMRDKRDKLPAFAPADLKRGDWVSIRAFVNDRGDVVASRADRQGARGTVRLQGPLDAGSTSGNLIIHGVGVATATMTRLDDVNGTQIRDNTPLQNPDPVQFLAQAAGQVVKARGTIDATTGTVTWDRAGIVVKHQFENENEQENEFQFEFENELEVPK